MGGLEYPNCQEWNEEVNSSLTANSWQSMDLVAETLPSDIEFSNICNFENETGADFDCWEELCSNTAVSPQSAETFTSQLTCAGDLLTNSPLLPSYFIPTSRESGVRSVDQSAPLSSSTSVPSLHNAMMDSEADFVSMLLDDDSSIEKLLEEIECDAVKRNKEVLNVALDHDYIKKDVCVSFTDVRHCDSSVSSPSSVKNTTRWKKEFSENARRIRNNEASKRSRALKKDRLKLMETDVQRLKAENQQMRVLLKDLEFTAKLCKKLLVASISSKK